MPSPQTIPKSTIRLAYRNGIKTTAKKTGRAWLVGGDFVEKGISVQIAAWHKDRENGGGFWAWHRLSGCMLVFDDHMTDDQIAEQETIRKAEYSK